MTTLTRKLDTGDPPSLRSQRPPSATPRPSDDWPHTRRVLPWLIALFLVMLFLIPFDSINLPVSLPINPALDRFVLGFVALVWVVVALAGRDRPRFKHAPLNAAIYLFFTVCFLSIAVNLHELSSDGELTLSLKQFSLVASYLTFFYIAATSIRRAEVTAFIKFTVTLAFITAAGTIYEYRSGSNLFFQLASDIFKGATVSPPPATSSAVGARPDITGPAIHGLADATLISAAVPFALVLASRARERTPALLWGLASITLIAGCVATQRKTAFIVPAVSLAVLFAYEPRRYVRYWPGLIVVAVVIHVAAPHAISGLEYQLGVGSSSSSTQTRTSDYSPVAPFIFSHLIFGRGYGSFDPIKYRILDDQMLGWLIEIGIVGTVAYAFVMFAAGFTVHRAARLGATTGDALMRAVVAVSAGFFVSNFLYDTFGFRQAPYIFFFVAALGVAYVGRPSGEEHVRPTEPAYGELAPPRSLAQSHVESASPGFLAESTTAELFDGLYEPRPGHAEESTVVRAPELSILIVTYRNPELTRSCLQSVLEHLGGIHHEVLVLDNASGDGTAEMVAEEFPVVEFRASDENLGFGRANNVLAAAANGEFLLLLNPDTIVPDGSISALLQLARAHPDGGLYGGRTLSPSGAVDPSSCWGAPSLWSLFCFATGLSTLFKRTKLFDPESLGDWPRDTVRQVDIVTGCLALIRADLWRELGGFDEMFWMYGEDADLSLRVAERGYHPMVTPAATITHVVGASSSPGDKAALLLGARTALIRKHWPVQKAQRGIALLIFGCGLRAALASEADGWRRAWRRRHEWSEAGASRSQS